MSGWKQELEEIRMKHGGILRPSDTVEYAKDPDTELHSRFEWDDSKAGHEHRLWQARQLIRAVVYIHPRENSERSIVVPMYHPQPSVAFGKDGDAGSRERGYDTIANIMSDSERREQLLDQAKAELAIFRRKYQELKELAPIFAAMDSLAVAG